MFRVLAFLMFAICCLALQRTPAFSQTTGGPGGGGGNATGGTVVINNNTGTVVISTQGGQGGNGGAAISGAAGAMAPAARVVRVVNFVITNNAQYIQWIKFYSSNHVWPSSTRVYVLGQRF